MGIIGRPIRLRACRPAHERPPNPQFFGGVVRAADGASLKIYVAGPYTKGDVARNVARAIEMGNELWRLGFVPFVPHLTHFWHFYGRKDYREWLWYDQQWLLVCDAVLRIPGESSGADEETAKAVEVGIPVFQSVADLQVWAAKR